MKAIPVSAAFLLVTAGYFGLFGPFVQAHHAVDINTATVAELDTLPGVGPATAQLIIDGRPYASAAEISTVKGIGDPGSKTYEDLIGHITAGGGASVQTQMQESEETEENEEEETATETKKSSSSSASRPKPPSSVSATIYAPRHAVVGADIWFEAEAKSGSSKLSRAKFEWSFGDGASVRGGSAVHAYAYPGTYAVMVVAEQGGVDGEARHTIEVLPLQLSLVAESDGSISLVSGSKEETDIGYWSIGADGKSFTFPAGTIVLPGESLRISPVVSGLDSGFGAVLFFSNGTFAARAQMRAAFDAAAAPARSAASVQQATGIFPSAAAKTPSPVEEQLAAVAAADASSALPAGWAYGLGLAALVLLGAAAVFYLQGEGAVAAQRSAAEEFEIIEAKR